MMERYATSKQFVRVMFITWSKERLTVSDEKTQEIQMSILFCKEIYKYFRNQGIYSRGN